MFSLVSNRPLDVMLQRLAYWLFCSAAVMLHPMVGETDKPRLICSDTRLLSQRVVLTTMILFLQG